MSHASKPPTIQPPPKAAPQGLFAQASRVLTRSNSIGGRRRTNSAPTPPSPLLKARSPKGSDGHSPPTSSPPEGLEDISHDKVHPAIRPSHINIAEFSTNIRDQMNIELTMTQAAYREAQQLLRSEGERTRRLEAELRREREIHSKLRNDLHLNETIEPGKVINRFRAINRAIENLTRSISEHMVNRWKLSKAPEPTTRDVIRFKYLKTKIPQGQVVPSLIQSTNGAGRPLEDFLDFGLRTVINKFLYDYIFGRFHPYIVDIDEERQRDEESEKLIDDRLSIMYKHIRSRDAQSVSGRWRVNAFMALEAGSSPAHADTFVEKAALVLEKKFLQPVLEGVYGTTSEPSISDPLRRQLKDVVRIAFEWNRMVKGEIILVDYEARIRDNNAPADGSLVYLEVPKHHKEGSKVIASVSLGLTSSESKGEGQKRLIVWQEKVRVLTEEYFDDD